MNPPTLRIIQGDLREALSRIEEGSVDCAVTSPPYKSKDGYSLELMRALALAVGRALRPGGRFWLNFGQLRKDFNRPFEAQQKVALSSGLKVGQTVAWVKSIALPSWRAGAMERVKAILKNMDDSPEGWVDAIREELWELEGYLKGPGEVLQRGHYQSINMRSPSLNYCWEPVFSFYKPPEAMTDRLALGVPFADKSNLKRGTRGKHGDLHCAGDVWHVPYKTTGAKRKKDTAELKHSYGFPEELVRRMLVVSNLEPGSTVFDPFLGGGTTAKVAKRLGFHVVGVEKDPEAARVAREAWEEA